MIGIARVARGVALWVDCKLCAQVTLPVAMRGIFLLKVVPARQALVGPSLSRVAPAQQKAARWSWRAGLVQQLAGT